ncbi:Asp23/Gls24 family envelope stress response protein [Nocardia sp. alder85J]|uniref:Asp23/Gls24 family envelope stress response protein n=1 Tax=Nocardia sp. alder85J TaxID=2862949 RepID=UPI001CD66CE8|nr:Asp23/Gls24 family envelope stress response protein [Nocardia sp. alder85J]MCX4097042.1 Asp23/Gls24 family envelope stress response protein [Nocardia sp. alder85J]
MTSTVTDSHTWSDTGSAAATTADNDITGPPPGEVDTAAIRVAAIAAAREITGVERDVEVRVKLARGEPTLALRLPIRYPMPIWQVATACRAHVRQRVQEQLGVRIRRVDIEVTDLPRKSL